MKTRLLCLLLGFLFHLQHTIVSGQSSTIGTQADDEVAYHIAADNAGNTYIGGSVNKDLLLVKQNAAGVTVWSQLLTFPDYPFYVTSNVNFIDIIGDTLFGCGNFDHSGNGDGGFYFKVNAQTGIPYWVRSENVFTTHFSCMRYVNGKYLLTGWYHNNQGAMQYSEVRAVSSLTGDLIWQTEILKWPGSGLPDNTPMRVHLVDATPVVNGKMYVIGNAQYTMNANVDRTILMGITENGVIFHQSNLKITYPGVPQDKFCGSQIDFADSGTDSLVIGFKQQSNAVSGYHSFGILKCNLQGNVGFAKIYDWGADFELMGMHQTPDGYVLSGRGWGASFSGWFLLKVSPNGTALNRNLVQSPNGDFFTLFDEDHHGQSCYRNGTHYFVAPEYHMGNSQRTIRKIITGDDLQDTSECISNTLPTLTTVDATIGRQFITRLPTLNVHPGFSFQYVTNGITIPNICDAAAVVIDQPSLCDPSLITATTNGMSNPVFTWSNGSNGPTTTAFSTDPLIVEITDDFCCRITDTIVPVITSDPLTVTLPSDTVICKGIMAVMYTIVPEIGGNAGNITYLWSDGSTDPTLAVNVSGTYWVDVTNDCGTVRDSIVVTFTPLPVIEGESNLIVCTPTFPVLYSVTQVLHATTMSWENGETTPDRMIDGPGTYTLTATNVCGQTSFTLTITEVSPPTISWVSSIDTCIAAGQSLTLAPILTDAEVINWSTGETTPTIAVQTSGTYTVSSFNACGDTSATTTVTINTLPELYLPAVLDTCFEEGVGFSYTAQGTGGSYVWNSGTVGATEWIPGTGSYTCTLTNGCGSDSKTMQVNRIGEVSLVFPHDSIELCAHTITASYLQIETNYELELLTEFGQPAGTTLSESGWYYIHAYNPCFSEWDSIYVNLRNEQYFYLPNTFTPNSDSYNEFYTYAGENIVLRDMQIFNRWGELVYSGEGEITGWDGMYNGTNCPDGVYSVQATYLDCFGIPQQFNGHVNLLR